jgi:hypothetical protein
MADTLDQAALGSNAGSTSIDVRLTEPPVRRIGGGCQAVSSPIQPSRGPDSSARSVAISVTAVPM